MVNVPRLQRLPYGVVLLQGTSLLLLLPIAAYLSLLTIITIVATFFTPETIGRDLDSIKDAIDEPATVEGHHKADYTVQSAV